MTTLSKLRADAATLARVHALILAGATQTEIGREFGVSQITVSRFIREHFELRPKLGDGGVR